MPGAYTRDFQIGLLTQLILSGQFMTQVMGYLRLTDFELPACRLIYEALQCYHMQYTQHPDFKTLQLHVQYLIQNMDGTTATLLDPTEFESLGTVLGMIARTRRDAINTDYYLGQLQGYLATVRMGQLQEQHGTMLQMGQGAEEYLTEAVKLNEEIAHHNASGYELDYVDSNPEPIMDASDVQRILTGIPPVDTWTGNGLGLGESAMIVACTGVGKTTGLINIGNAANVTNWRSLFMTLELSGARIKRRRQAMMAGIPAQWFKVPIGEWPVEMKWRFSWIIDPRNPKFDYCCICDMSKRAPTVADIDTMIQKWLTNEAKKGTVEQCKLCCIDWLDKIDPGGLNVTKNMREDTIHIKISEALAEMGRRYNLAMWWATQATRDAEGREILMKQHTAYGYHKNDPLDLSIGLAPAIEIKPKEQKKRKIRDDDDEEMPACNRQLVVSIMKNRDNPDGKHARIYQSPTLAFWTDSRAYTAAEAILRSKNLEGYSAHLYQNVKRQVNYAYPELRAVSAK